MADISAVTATIVTRSGMWNKRMTIAEIAIGDGSEAWPDGGVSLTPEDLGMEVVEMVLFDGGSLVYAYDYDNQKVLAYTAADTTGATAVLVAATGAVPNETVRCIAIGYGG